MSPQTSPETLTAIRGRVQAFDLRALFLEELGWDRARQTLPMTVDGAAVTLTALAEKRGLIAFHCPLVPDHRARVKLSHELAKLHREHILVYADPGQGTQIWQWVRRAPGQPAANREKRFDRGQPGDAVAQAVAALAFDLAAEDGLDIVTVTGQVRAAFDVERVTRRFYDRFKQEHTAFLKFIHGIPADDDREWYASVMLNRLMFVYFIQKKGFLDGDRNYLRSKLDLCQAHGKHFLRDFYRDFLRVLFFDGLAHPAAQRSAAVLEMIGDVPYLNGGIFQPHPLEERYADIQIANAAFAQLFDFFDQYHWHLDERPLRADNEINPDVLGYIFEKYINQKEMGAYYTKEDITEYIGKNTLLPYLLDAAAKLDKVAFDPAHGIWRLLAEDPARYIYPAVGHGAQLPLPPEIAAGVDDVAQRGDWNKPAPAEYALPTEIWREVVARRQRYAELDAKLRAGAVTTPNDLITLNLDIRQFVQDVIDQADSPDLVRALWQTLTGLAALDPTCGSGAFLFAALNLLEPLYAACLERMEGMVAEADAAGRSAAALKDFRATLREANTHPNRRYFILKRIMVHNLFGVDIMEEAVEICKLRLFLKLVAQVEEAGAIEPLPDIDFNIRAGNTLVGYATREEVRRGLEWRPSGQGAMIFGEEAAQLAAMEEDAAAVERLWRAFREQQTTHGGQVTPEDKAELRRRLAALADKLDRLLARQYGIDPDRRPADLARWRQSHQPFHWFTEFYGVMARGGFDVIIGNPPYVNRKKVNYQYYEPNYPDIYASVILRALQLCHFLTPLGLIVPLSLQFSYDFAELRKRLHAHGANWFSSFDNIPASVFSGVSQRCTILICRCATQGKLYSAPMYRWRAQYRQYLVSLISHTEIDDWDTVHYGIPKLNSPIQLEILRRIHSRTASKTGRSGKRVYFSQAARNFVSAFLEYPPCLSADTLKEVEPSKIGSISIDNDGLAYIAFSSLVGELYLWYWLVRGDGFDVTGWVIADFVAFTKTLTTAISDAIEDLANLLHARRYEALVFKKNAGKYVGNYNYSEMQFLTRRVDLLLMAGLGLDRKHALEVFDHVNRVLSINVYAGEKSIPTMVKQKYPPAMVDHTHQERILHRVDSILARHYGFTAEELDFILNYDIKYRMGDALGGEDE